MRESVTERGSRWLTSRWLNYYCDRVLDASTKTITDLLMSSCCAPLSLDGRLPRLPCQLQA